MQRPNRTKADEYRTPVMILGDGVIGQMMEPVELPAFTQKQPYKPWALKGAKKGQPPNVIRSLFMLPGEEGKLEQHNYDLKAKYDRMAEREVMSEAEHMDDAEFAVVAFGTSARIAKSAIEIARGEGIKVGLIRPITLFPFPEKVIAKASERVAHVLVVEMNLGQMVEDVRLAVNGRVPVWFYGRPGGAILGVDGIVQAIRSNAQCGARNEACSAQRL